MAIPLIVGIGLGIGALMTACDDEEKVGRDGDEQDAKVPPEPVLSSCEFPAQARLSSNNKALLACAKNPGTRFEVFDGRELQQYDVPVDPPPFAGRPLHATAVQNFAIDGIDNAIFVLTRYSVAERPAGNYLIDGVLSVYQEGEVVPRAQKRLPISYLDEDLETSRFTALQAMKDRITGEVSVNVLQSGGGIEFSRFRFHGFEAQSVLELDTFISLGEFAVAEEGNVVSALFPVRLAADDGYRDPLILVKESALQVSSLDLVREQTLDYSEPFLEGFHPTPAPFLDDINVRLPAPESSAEFLSGTTPWLMTVPGLSGKILIYSVSEAGDAHSVGGGNIENWQTLISLPTEEDVLHVTHTAQQFDEEGRVTNVGEIDYFALTSSGEIFYFPLSDSLRSGQVAQVENFDRTKARGFFIMNNQFVIVLAGEEGNQFYTLPVPNLRVGPRISVE